ncbi:MAG: hypothetical protein ISQ97_03680 [Flavobacteriales bacterium]|nr:hypothetical protein [Flavobacteriales bacterium]
MGLPKLDGVFVEPVELPNLVPHEAPETWQVQPAAAGLFITENRASQRFIVSLIGMDGRILLKRSGTAQLVIPWSAWTEGCAVITIQNDTDQLSARVCQPH